LLKTKNCPIEILKDFAKNVEMKCSVAFNKKCPSYLLEDIYNSLTYNSSASDIKNNVKIKRSITLNPNCPIHILEKLSNDIDKDIRNFVAINDRTENYILNKLLNDSYYHVRLAVLKRCWFDCPENENTIHILNKFAKDKNHIIRAEVAIKADLNILNLIYKDKNSWVANCMVQNKFCTYEMLKYIYKKHKNLKEEIIKHPNWKVVDFT